MSNPAPGFLKHPDYQVEIKPLKATLTVKLNGTVVADSDGAVEVLETRHRPVWYIPMDDIDQSLIRPTDTDTFCPFKGHASYWTIDTGEARAEDAVWAYLDPFDECAPLAGYASFYTNKVDLLIDGQPASRDGPGWT